tara:strand:- start:791 stop:1030 length:240 start_codon:yes stop_codon:yes gene_type:complete
MSFTKKIPSYKTQAICSDGSVVNVSFPYNKKRLFLTNDLKNNVHYLSPLKVESSSKNDKMQRLGKNKFGFEFFSLIDKK